MFIWWTKVIGYTHTAVYYNQLVSFCKGHFEISVGSLRQVKGFKLMKKESTRATHEFIIKLTIILLASHRGSSILATEVRQSHSNVLEGAWSDVPPSRRSLFAFHDNVAWECIGNEKVTAVFRVYCWGRSRALELFGKLIR